MSRTRHIHLDFHTSGLVPDVGKLFDAKRFADTLERAHVASICCFAKCHHGYSYYPTKLGTMHPTLERDLLGEQIEACRERGIDVTAYTTVVFDELAADTYPDRLQVDATGRRMGAGPLSPGWQWLCMNTPQADDVIEQSLEAVTSYDVSGLFVDIVFQGRPGCVCKRCVASMTARGLDPTSDDDLHVHSLMVEREFMARMSAALRDARPELEVFYNSRLRLGKQFREELQYESHVELESLPSGGWGYNHFPLHVRYVQTLGVHHFGHTGRFHRAWGDFGGLKPQAALDFECLRMLANGSGCGVGDQLDPSGELDPGVYNRIGATFEKLVAAEPWTLTARPLADIAVVLSTPSTAIVTGAYPSEEGAMLMLMELHQQFQIVEPDDDFSRYRAVVLPGGAVATPELRGKLDAYVAAGGALLVAGDAIGSEPWDTLGVTVVGDSPYVPEFLHLTDASIGEPFNYAIEEQGVRVRALDGTDVVAQLGEPLFNREVRTFMSHAHFPMARVTDSPAVTRRGRVIVFSHPVFRAYKRSAVPVVRELVGAMLDRVMPDPIVRCGAPVTAEVTAAEHTGRTVVHVLNYIPRRRGENLEIVETVIPLHDVPVSIRAESAPSRVYLAPQGTDLDFRYEAGRVEAVVGRIDGHQMICVE